MGVYGELIDELEDAITRGSNNMRVETLRKVTDLFVNDAPAFGEAQVALFDDVIGRLALEIEQAARVELSTRLAPIANAPIEVVRALSKDQSIAVAGPVLAYSPRVDEQTLVEVARTMGQEHLLAISGRASVAPVVTDVLVKRGDAEVVRTVAGNAGAAFSQSGYATLVERAKTDEQLAERVGMRKDISPQHFRAILSVASDRVRKALFESASEQDKAAVQQVVKGVSDRIAADTEPKKRDYTVAARAVNLMHRAGRLGQPEVLGYAKAAKFEESVCALSALCGVPIEVIERLMLGDRPDPILILCKAAGLDWETVRALILVRPGGATTGGLDEAMDAFKRLTPATAQRVMRFWQVRQSASAA